MIISISGSPGTGKTKVARILAKKLDANLIVIKHVIKKIRCGYDRQRKTKIVDVRELQKAVNKRLQDRTNIIEGHLSHLLKTDIVIILRTNPDVLKKRLSKRKWTKRKIKENTQAEILDAITIESVQKHGKNKIFEIDTSSSSPAATAGTITTLLNKHGSRKYSVGRIDWSERYKNELLGV